MRSRPSEARRKAFAEKFPFPLAGSLDAILADKSVDCVEILTPPNTHLDLVRQCAAAGKHILLEKPLEVSTERAVELVETARQGRRHARRDAAAPLSACCAEAARDDARGRARQDRELLHRDPAVAAAELLRSPGPRHQGARWRRRAPHAGHPHARPDAEPRRPDQRGARLCDRPRACIAWRRKIWSRRR